MIDQTSLTSDYLFGVQSVLLTSPSSTAPSSHLFYQVEKEQRNLTDPDDPKVTIVDAKLVMEVHWDLYGMKGGNFIAKAYDQIPHRIPDQGWVESVPIVVNGTTTSGAEFIAASQIARDPVFTPAYFASLMTINDDFSTPMGVLERLARAGSSITPELICELELTQFGKSQSNLVLPVLWKYIIEHRNSQNHAETVAVGSAIRKYVAMVPIGELGKLTEILASGDRVLMPPEIELEIAKMVYRKYEVSPPPLNVQPDLAERLWSIASIYVVPRMLLRDNYSSVASLAIEALVAMRSRHALEAWRTAQSCPHKWFGEIVSDHLLELRSKWSSRSAEATTWLDDLRDGVLQDRA